MMKILINLILAFFCVSEIYATDENDIDLDVEEISVAVYNTATRLKQTTADNS